MYSEIIIAVFSKIGISPARFNNGLGHHQLYRYYVYSPEQFLNGVLNLF